MSVFFVKISQKLHALKKSWCWHQGQEVQTEEGFNLLNGLFLNTKHCCEPHSHNCSIYFSCLFHKLARLNVSLLFLWHIIFKRTDSNNIEIRRLSRHVHYVTFFTPRAAQPGGYPVRIRNAQKEEPSNVGHVWLVWLFLESFARVWPQHIWRLSPGLWASYSF